MLMETWKILISVLYLLFVFQIFFKKIGFVSLVLCKMNYSV